MQKLETSIRILAFVVAGAVLLSLYAISNTLLYHHQQYDYVVFKTIGDGWAAGLVPYRDLFDHKGPFVYVVQLIASLISSSKVGLWVMELIWVVATCEMLYRCGRYLGASRVLNYSSVMVALLTYSCFVDGGNSVEIWSLPFEVLPLLMILRFLAGRSKLSVATLMGGFCFGIVAMIRLNNNAMIVGLVIGMLIYLCYRRSYGRILHCIGWFLTGLVAAVIPFVIYFLCAGAFEEFIYCVFYFNMLYMGKMGTRGLATLISNMANLFPCLIFIPVLLLYARKKRVDMLLILAPVAVVLILTFSQGIGFLHYFLMTVPVAALSIQMLWPLHRYIKLAVFGLYFIFCGHILKVLTPVRIDFIQEMREVESVFPGVQGQLFISDFIPDGDKASIYVYGDMGPAAALNANGYMPVGKYFFLQDFLQEVDTTIHDEIIERFREAGPVWIIVQSDKMDMLEECMDGRYVEIPGDSLPESCPEGWHIYLKK